MVARIRRSSASCGKWRAGTRRGCCLNYRCPIIGRASARVCGSRHHLSSARRRASHSSATVEGMAKNEAHASLPNDAMSSHRRRLAGAQGHGARTASAREINGSGILPPWPANARARDGDGKNAPPSYAHGAAATRHLGVNMAPSSSAARRMRALAPVNGVSIVTRPSRQISPAQCRN